MFGKVSRTPFWPAKTTTVRSVRPAVHVCRGKAPGVDCTSMTSEDRTNGVLVAHGCTSDDVRQIDRLSRSRRVVIPALAVREILDERIAEKLAS